MAQKTSAYVFPFRPFNHLDNPMPVAELLPAKTVDKSYFNDILAIVAPPISVTGTGSAANRIVDLFADDQVVFGEASWITDLRQHWADEAQHFIGQNLPIEFTILGFPFKAPVPLKTNRLMPDFGELAMLKRLYELARAVTAIHAPGARIHIFAEGAFARINGMPQADADNYFDGLVRMAADYGYDKHIVLHDTSRIADETEGFAALWSEVEQQIAARRDAGDERTITALRDSIPVTFHLNANPGVDDDLLRRAYLNDASARDLRDSLDKRSEQAVVSYRAFLEARDRIQLLEHYAPKALAMTVSPRPGRLGVRPLPAPSDVLPYHGLPVWNPQTKHLHIEYRWDLLSEPGTVLPIAVIDDSDPAPFLYLRPAP